LRRSLPRFWTAKRKSPMALAPIGPPIFRWCAAVLISTARDSRRGTARGSKRKRRCALKMATTPRFCFLISDRIEPERIVVHPVVAAEMHHALREGDSDADAVEFLFQAAVELASN